MTWAPACNVLRVRKNPDGTVQMLVSAVARARVKNYTRDEYLRANIELMPEVASRSGGISGADP